MNFKNLRTILMFIFVFSLVVTARNSSQALSIPQDHLRLFVISDGTHEEAGSETFINSKNGYKVGDNTSTDGVVSSGDYVNYGLDINIVAGNSRHISIELGSKGDSFDVSDISNLSLSSSLVDINYDRESHRFELQVPRGIVTTIRARFSVKAKDSKGKISKENSLWARLTNGDYVVNEASKEITVVSSSLGDLTIDTDRQYTRSYTDTTPYGEIKIVPQSLSIDGYSKNGLSSGGAWHTDVDVSNFPKGTKFYHDVLGKLEDLEVVDGKIKDLRGSGDYVIRYVLPKEGLPTEKNPVLSYSYSIIPYKDSFKVGDSFNIEDIGLGHDKDYKTGDIYFKGHKLSSIEGLGYHNNNFSYATWKWFPKSNLGFTSRVYLPRRSGSLLYNNDNVYFNNSSPWFKQGDFGYSSFYTTFVEDNDMYLAILANRESNTKSMALGSTMLKGPLAVNFSKDKDVVVYIGDNRLDPSYYRVFYRESNDAYLGGSENWFETNRAFNDKFNQFKVLISKEAFSKYEGNVSVYMPYKALTSYDREKIKTSPLVFKTIVISNPDSEVLSYDKGGHYFTNTLNLLKVETPSLISNITSYGAKLDSFSHTYRVSGYMTDEIRSPISESGYKFKKVLTLSDIYDPKSFKIRDKGYKVSVTGPHEVTITGEDMNVNGYDGKIGYLSRIEFSVDALSNLLADNYSFNIAANTKVDYPGFKTISGGSISSTSNLDLRVNVGDTTGVGINSTPLTEVYGLIKYDVSINAGGGSFSTNVVFPNDKEADLLEELNRVNHSNISLDSNGLDTTKTMDGYGRSKFSGYTIDKIHFKDFKDTEVYINNKKYEIGKDGYLIIPNIEEVSSYLSTHNDGMVLKVKGRESVHQNYAANIEITLKPKAYREGDIYCLWVRPTRIDNSNEVMPWPSYSLIIKSSISGNVAEFLNRDSEDKKGLGGIGLNLYKVNGLSYEKVTSTTTLENGDYTFDMIPSGKYRVSLDGVNFMPDGITLANVTSKSFNLDKTNRFGVKEGVINIFSGRGLGRDIDIDLAKDTDYKNADYGFMHNNSNVRLDELPARVSDNGSFSKVSFDVVVKNTGNTTLSNASLNALVSSKLRGLRASSTYRIERDKYPAIKKIWTMTGAGSIVETVDNKLRLVSSNLDEYSESYDVDSLGKILYISGNDFMYTGYIVTTKGLYAYNNKDGVFSIASANPSINGNVDMTSPPIYVFNPGNIYSHYNSGFLVLTAKGSYVVKPDPYFRPFVARIWESSLSGARSSDLSKLREWVKDGNIKYSLGSGKFQGDGGLLVVSNTGEALKFDAMPVDRYLAGSDNAVGIHTDSTSALILGKKGDTIFKIDYNGYQPLDIGHDAKYMEILGDDDGFISTEEGNYLIARNASRNYKLDMVKGTILDVYRTYTGYYISTDVGVYNLEVDSDGTKRDINLASSYEYSQIEGLAGEVLRGYPNFILTTKGIYSLNGNIANLEGSFSGKVLSYNVRPITKSEFGMDGAIASVLTSNGYYLYNTLNHKEGTNRPYFKKWGQEFINKDNEELEIISETKEGDNRRYKINLPDISPNKTITVRLEGSSLKEKESYLIGSEVYLDSSKTPRGGITTSKVTGENKDLGIPDDFKLPLVNDFIASGIKGNPTVMLNSNIDSEGDKDDLADQVAAKIVADPQATDKLGSVSGRVFYDENKNYEMDDNKFFKGVKVDLIDSDSSQLVDSVVTNDNGEYSFKNVPLRSYDLHFYIDGLKYGEKRVEVHNDDVDSYGNTIAGLDLEKTPNAVFNLGLSGYDSSLKVLNGVDGLDKIYGDLDLKERNRYLESYGGKLESIDSLKFDDGDSDPRTQGYAFKIINVGDKNLSHVKLDFALEKGNKRGFVEYKYVEGEVIKPITLKDGIAYDGDKELVLKPNSYILGYSQVGYTLGNSEYKDKLIADANIINSTGDKLGSVRGEDSLDSIYIYREPKDVNISLYGVKNSDDIDNKKLIDGVINLYKKVGDEYKYIGKYYIVNGKFTTKLSQGNYKIVQDSTSFGYMIPDKSGWMFSLKYKGEDKVVNLTAGSNMPYAEIKKSETGWADISLYNYSGIELPLTGGNFNLIAIGLSFSILGIGLLLVFKKELV